MGEFFLVWVVVSDGEYDKWDEDDEIDDNFFLLLFIRV